MQNILYNSNTVGGVRCYIFPAAGCGIFSKFLASNHHNWTDGELQDRRPTVCSCRFSRITKSRTPSNMFAGNQHSRLVAPVRTPSIVTSNRHILRRLPSQESPPTSVSVSKQKKNAVTQKQHDTDGNVNGWTMSQSFINIMTLPSPYCHWLMYQGRDSQVVWN